MADVDKNLESKPINSNIEMDYLNSADASAELVTNQDQIYKTIRSQIIAARHQIYSSVNASMLAGVDSCWINFFDPEVAAKELGLPGNEEVLMLLDLGYAAEGTKPLANHEQRKPLSQTVQYL